MRRQEDVRRGLSPGNLTISVADTAVGPAPETLASVLQPFVQDEQRLTWRQSAD